jgi:hypothetical protein
VFLTNAPRPARPIDARILATLQRRGAGTVFVPNEFLGLGTRTAVDVALAGCDRLRLPPSGAYAANLLGLSEQVPAKVVFLTDGATRAARIGSTTI